MAVAENVVVAERKVMAVAGQLKVAEEKVAAGNRVSR